MRAVEHLVPCRLLALAALCVASILSACATTRLPRRGPVPEPLPLVAGVCPGAVDDYAGEGRDLLRALRERAVFRTAVLLPDATARPDVVLAPSVTSQQSHPRMAMVTFVPWFVTATVFPWLVQQSHTVQVRVFAADAERSACRLEGAAPLRLADSPRRQTTAMIGWTAPFLALLPGWELGSSYEFRPAVDSLLAHREELLRLTRP